MMTEKMKETLERTERALCMHLAVLDGDVERVEGHVENHMVIDGIKDCTTALKNIYKIMALANGNGAAKQTVATVTAVK